MHLMLTIPILLLLVSCSTGFSKGPYKTINGYKFDHRELEWLNIENITQGEVFKKLGPPSSSIYTAGRVEKDIYTFVDCMISTEHFILSNSETEYCVKRELVIKFHKNKVVGFTLEETELD